MDNKKHILVVEDYPYTRELYEEVLTEHGYAVTCASDGREAMSVVKKGVYDLVLLDMMMPIVNGVGFLKYLKSLDIAKKPHVILLTNLAHEQVINEALALGAHSYFIKSELNPDELLSHISKVLN
jgi:CheY-like chemotaxis protein